MPEEPDIEYILERLGSENPRHRAMMLAGLSESPALDARVLAACERLLDDREIALLSLPYSFGEVRALATEPVALIRVGLGITEPVVAEDVMVIQDTSGVHCLAKAAGIPMESGPGVDGVLATLRKLAAAGQVPRTNRGWTREEMEGLRAHRDASE